MCFCFMAGNLQDNRYSDFAEAIKSGLREGVPYHVHRGEACLSYTNLRETQQRMNDALEYIEHLEKQNKDLQVRVDALSSKAALFDEAMIMGAKMERERDALMHWAKGRCDTCAHNGDCVKHDPDPEGLIVHWYDDCEIECLEEDKDDE